MTKVIILLFRMNAIKSGCAQDVYFKEHSATLTLIRDYHDYYILPRIQKSIFFSLYGQ